MISAKGIAPLRGLAPDGDTTEKLKRDFGRARKERRPFFLEASEFDKILDWKLGSQYGRVSRHRKLLLDTSIPIVTRAAFEVRAAERGETLKIRTGILTALPIVGVPVASAILALVMPEEYGVIDFRGWRQVFGHKRPTSRFRVIYDTCNMCGGSRMNFLGCHRKSNTPFGTTIAKRKAYNKSLDASGFAFLREVRDAFAGEKYLSITNEEILRRLEKIQPGFMEWAQQLPRLPEKKKTQSANPKNSS